MDAAGKARPAAGRSERAIRSAVLLSIGSEITVGETRDTNAGDLARTLARSGVEIARIVALPDRLGLVSDAFREGLEAADLVVSTGGLGPTPDDLTREAIAAVCGETPRVDPHLERWLRVLFSRRRLPFPEANLKQAWLIPSAVAIPNERGTAPGWWVERPDGRLVVALPGPPSEMRPMWQAWALPRLQERGLGEERATVTYRLAGIGESAVAAQLGEAILRAANPVVATYARADAVDVRISARGADGRPASELLAEAEEAVLRAVGERVWGRDDETWTDALGRLLEARGWQAALVEIGTGASALRLLGEAVWLRGASLLPAAGDGERPLGDLADEARSAVGADVGLAVKATESGHDTRVEVALRGPFGSAERGSVAFLGGAEGRRRAALAAAAFFFETLAAQPERAAPPGIERQ